MICAACNANHGTFMTKNSDGSFTMKVKKDTCTRLQKSCYKYLVERKTATENVEFQAKIKKARGAKTKVRAQLKTWNEKCRGTDAGCTLAEKQKIAQSVTKESTDAARLTTEEKKKLNKETKMVVQMPTGCTSETSCQWICDNMVGATGAKKESEYKGLDGTATTRRMLATIKTEYTTTGGYEPDSDDNTAGFDTEFSDSVAVLPKDDDDEKKGGAVLIVIVGLIVVVIALIIVGKCVMDSKKDGNT